MQGNGIGVFGSDINNFWLWFGKEAVALGFAGKWIRLCVYLFEKEKKLRFESVS